MSTCLCFWPYCDIHISTPFETTILFSQTYRVPHPTEEVSEILESHVQRRHLPLNSQCTYDFREDSANRRSLGSHSRTYREQRVLQLGVSVDHPTICVRRTRVPIVFPTNRFDTGSSRIDFDSFFSDSKSLSPISFVRSATAIFSFSYSFSFLE